MPVLFIFLMGVANFALHMAVMASDHPMITEVRRAEFLGRHGPWLFFVLEFALLLGSLGFAANGSAVALYAYAGYTAVNGGSSWMILSGRI